MTRRRLPVLALAAIGLWAAACATVPSVAPPEVPGGSPQRGQQLISQYGCGSCHTVPGVRGADGLVGPPLTRMGARAYIAGKLPNNVTNMEHWIMDPQEVVPGNAMPDLGVSAIDARDIAAYLFTLD